MKQKLITIILFIFIVALVGCSSDVETPESENENAGISYNESEFEISLPDTSGNLVKVSPDGKTIYAYFTGVG